MLAANWPFKFRLVYSKRYQDKSNKCVKLAIDELLNNFLLKLNSKFGLSYTSSKPIFDSKSYSITPWGGSVSSGLNLYVRS